MRRPVLACLRGCSFAHAIGPLEGAEVIETNAIFTQQRVQARRQPLAHIERVAHDKVMHGVGAGKIEAEQVQRDCPGCGPHLALLNDVPFFNITVVMHV